MYFFKAQKLTPEVAKEFENQDIYQATEKHDSILYYREDTMQSRANNLCELMPYLTPISMKETICDRDKCFRDMGLPDGIKSMCVSYSHNFVRVSYQDNGENKVIEIPNTKLHEYDHEEEYVFYLCHKEYIDAEVTSYVAKTIMKKLNTIMGRPISTYSPHKLSQQESLQLARELVQDVKNEDIYIGDNELIGILTTLLLNDGEVFVVFEN